MNSNVSKVLENLRSHVESSIREDAEGNKWQSVFLENARPAGMTRTGFRSCLIALSKKNLYKRIDGVAFGDVKLA